MRMQLPKTTCQNGRKPEPSSVMSSMDGYEFRKADFKRRLEEGELSDKKPIVDDPKKKKKKTKKAEKTAKEEL